MITPKDFINHRAEKRNGYLAIEAYPHYILLKPQTGEILLESEGEEEPTEEKLFINSMDELKIFYRIYTGSELQEGRSEKPKKQPLPKDDVKTSDFISTYDLLKGEYFLGKNKQEENDGFFAPQPITFVSGKYAIRLKDKFKKTSGNIHERINYRAWWIKNRNSQVGWMRYMSDSYEDMLDQIGNKEPIVTRGLVSQVYQHYESEPLTLKDQ
ncbi:MAG: hypothetical protein KBA90_09995 [Chitinophagaceae bacterium]|nr:hypothetical protein [Chitinophagaceae bacterium]MBP7152144.1 hypothetical protein [Paludibacteraceae bacterium]